jgi:hypothetical protein
MQKLYSTSRTIEAGIPSSPPNSMITKKDKDRALREANKVFRGKPSETDFGLLILIIIIFSWVASACLTY